MSDERKKESEQYYKNEIKYLIDKLLKAKNKLLKERDNKSTIHNASIISSSTANYLNQLNSNIDFRCNSSCEGRNTVMMTRNNSTSKLF